MVVEEESKEQIKDRVAKEMRDKAAADFQANKQRLDAEDARVSRLTGKELKDIGNSAFQAGFDKGKRFILEKQIEQEEQEKEKPLTLAEQYKQLEGQIKYARSRELEKIQDRKIISIINSLASELEATLRSLIELERRGLVFLLSREEYEKRLRAPEDTSRINSTTRDNLKFIAWAVEQLKLLQALSLGGNSVTELPVSLYPDGKKANNQYIQKTLRLAEKRRIKADARLKKLEKNASEGI